MQMPKYLCKHSKRNVVLNALSRVMKTDECLLDVGPRRPMYHLALILINHFIYDEALMTFSLS